MLEGVLLYLAQRCIWKELDLRMGAVFRSLVCDAESGLLENDGEIPLIRSRLCCQKSFRMKSSL